ncbi:MotE family protein [Thermosulfuriphilus sp.]
MRGYKQLILVLAILKALVALALGYLYWAGYLHFSFSGPDQALAEGQPSAPMPPGLECNQQVFEDLRLKRLQIEEKQKALGLREKELKLLKDQVEKRLAALTELEQEIDQKLNELKVIKDERFRLLVKIYSNMKPKKAAPLLSKLDVNTLTKLFQAMPTDQVSKILAAMDPEVAAQVSARLSGQEE